MPADGEQLCKPLGNASWQHGWPARLGLGMLWAVLLVRLALPELPFRFFSLIGSGMAGGWASGWDGWELLRLLFSLAMLGSLLLLAVQRCWTRQAVCRGPGWLAAAFVWFGMAAIQVALAANRRAALTGWFEQFSLLLAAWTMAQFHSSGSRERRRLALFCALAGGFLALHAFVDYAVRLRPLAQAYEQNAATAVTDLGLVPDTPPANLLAARARDSALTGRQATANLFAALLLPLLGGAVAWLAGEWRRRATPLRRWLAVANCLLLVGALLASEARGAWLAAAGALVLLAYDRLNQRLPRPPRIALAVATGLASLAMGGWGLAHGLANDQFPDASLTVRWHYWRGCARLVASHPWRGVGPGNFADAYPAMRLPGAEEAIQLPHNFVWQALVEDGLPAGTLYILLGLGMVVAAWRSRPGLSPKLQHGQSWNSGGREWSGRPTSLPLIATTDFNNLPIPTRATAEVMPAARPAVPPSTASPAAAGDHWLLAGLLAATLYALLENGLAVPAPALLFWLFGGTLAGGGWPERRLPRWAWGALAGLLLAIGTAASCWLLPPVAIRGHLLSRAAGHLHRGNLPAATAAAQAAVTADPLDPVAAAECARLLVASCPRTRDDNMRRQLLAAREAASLAVQRNPAAAGNQLLLARLHWYVSDPDELAWAWRRQGGDLRQRPLPLHADGTPSATAFAWLTAAALLDGQPSTATLAARRALQLAPTSAALHVNLGDAAWRDGNTIEARQAWQAVAANRPPSPDWKLALEHLRLAVAADPQDFRLRLELARLECLLEQPAAAQATLLAGRRAARALAPHSLCRPTPGEELEFDLLAARAATLAKPPPSQTSPPGQP